MPLAVVADRDRAASSGCAALAAEWLRGPRSDLPTNGGGPGQVCCRAHAAPGRAGRGAPWPPLDITCSNSWWRTSMTVTGHRGGGGGPVAIAISQEQRAL